MLSLIKMKGNQWERWKGRNSFKKIVLKNGPKRREGRGEERWHGFWQRDLRGGRREEVCFDREEGRDEYWEIGGKMSLCMLEMQYPITWLKSISLNLY